MEQTGSSSGAEVHKVFSAYPVRAGAFALLKGGEGTVQIFRCEGPAGSGLLGAAVAKKLHSALMRLLRRRLIVLSLLSSGRWLTLTYAEAKVVALSLSSVMVRSPIFKEGFDASLLLLPSMPRIVRQTDLAGVFILRVVRSFSSSVTFPVR